MTRMRRNHGGWLLVALCLSCLWRSSEAVVLVEDAINEANTLQALIKTQIQVEQQLRMLQNQATALENDAMNLKQSPLALLGQLQSLWGAYNAVLNNARGLGFQLGQVATHYQTTYPSMVPQSVQTMLQQSAAMLDSIRAASQTAVQAQSVADRLNREAAMNAQAMAAAQSAVGQHQIAQVHAQISAETNELLGNLAQTEAATGRVQTEWIALQAKEQEDADVRNTQFMQSYGSQGFKALGQKTGTELP